MKHLRSINESNINFKDEIEKIEDIFIHVIDKWKIKEYSTELFNKIDNSDDRNLLLYFIGNNSPYSIKNKITIIIYYHSYYDSKNDYEDYYNLKADFIKFLNVLKSRGYNNCDISFDDIPDETTSSARMMTISIDPKSKIVNELNRSTYLSAIDKLNDLGHNSRASRMLSHVNNASDKSGNDYDKIYPYHFTIYGIQYKIVDFKLYSGVCYIIFISLDNNNKILAGLDMFSGTISWQTMKSGENHGSFSKKKFLFGSRNDAIRFKKFILDEGEDEFDEWQVKNIKSWSLNKYYN